MTARLLECMGVALTTSTENASESKSLSIHFNISSCSSWIMDGFQKIRVTRDAAALFRLGGRIFSSTTMCSQPSPRS